MPILKRVHRASDETWQQLELRLTFPEQHVYELILPAERRATIIRLHFEGWSKKAISEYLHSPQLLLWELNHEEWRKVIPRKHLQPLMLWERGADGIVQIIPMAPTYHQTQAVSPLVQVAFAL